MRARAILSGPGGAAGTAESPKRDTAGNSLLSTFSGHMTQQHDKSSKGKCVLGKLMLCVVKAPAETVEPLFWVLRSSKQSDDLPVSSPSQLKNDGLLLCCVRRCRAGVLRDTAPCCVGDDL